MADIYVQRMARVLTQYSLSIKKGDRLGIEAHPLATPLVLEVVREVGGVGDYASFMDDEDPVTRGEEISQQQDRLSDSLKGKHGARLRGQATDLTPTGEGRTWPNDDGRGKFPGGEFFTGPVGTS